MLDNCIITHINTTLNCDNGFEEWGWNIVILLQSALEIVTLSQTDILEGFKVAHEYCEILDDTSMLDRQERGLPIIRVDLVFRCYQIKS